MKKLTNKQLRKLFNLGVFVQPDGSISVSEGSTMESDLDSLYVRNFNSVKETVDFLEERLEELAGFLTSSVDNLSKLLDSMLIIESSTNHFSSFAVEGFVDALIAELKTYDDFTETIESLMLVKEKSHLINNRDASFLSYFSTSILLASRKVLEELDRIGHINDVFENLKVAASSKKIVEAIGFGIEEGVGPTGRNSPYGNFDGAHDRVMDGTGIRDYSGHFYEKFKNFNKLRSNPVGIKKLFKYRGKGPYFNSPRKRRRKRRQKGRDLNKSFKGHGSVYLDVKNDPARIVWDDHQRTPYLWSDRGTNGTYPSWSSYR